MMPERPVACVPAAQAISRSLASVLDSASSVFHAAHASARWRLKRAPSCAFDRYRSLRRSGARRSRNKPADAALCCGLSLPCTSSYSRQRSTMKRALREIADHNTAGSNDAPATARAGRRRTRSATRALSRRSSAPAPAAPPRRRRRRAPAPRRLSLNCRAMTTPRQPRHPRRRSRRRQHQRHHKLCHHKLWMTQDDAAAPPPPPPAPAPAPPAPAQPPAPPAPAVDQQRARHRASSATRRRPSSRRPPTAATSRRSGPPRRAAARDCRRRAVGVPGIRLAAACSGPRGSDRRRKAHGGALAAAQAPAPAPPRPPVPRRRRGPAPAATTTPAAAAAASGATTTTTTRAAGPAPNLRRLRRAGLPRDGPRRRRRASTTGAGVAFRKGRSRGVVARDRIDAAAPRVEGAWQRAFARAAEAVGVEAAKRLARGGRRRPTTTTPSRVLGEAEASRRKPTRPTQLYARAGEEIVVTRDEDRADGWPCVACGSCRTDREPLGAATSRHTRRRPGGRRTRRTRCGRCRAARAAATSVCVCLIVRVDGVRARVNKSCFQVFELQARLY